MNKGIIALVCFLSCGSFAQDALKRESHGIGSRETGQQPSYQRPVAEEELYERLLESSGKYDIRGLGAGTTLVFSKQEVIIPANMKQIPFMVVEHDPNFIFKGDGKSEGKFVNYSDCYFVMREELNEKRILKLGKKVVLAGNPTSKIIKLTAQDSPKVGAKLEVTIPVAEPSAIEALKCEGYSQAYAKKAHWVPRPDEFVGYWTQRFSYEPGESVVVKPEVIVDWQFEQSFNRRFGEMIEPPAKPID